MIEDFWKAKRVFVRGATGFVGSALVKSLLRLNADVTILCFQHEPESDLVRSGDIRKTSVVDGCLEDRDLLSDIIGSHQIEVVYHLGAQAIVTNAREDPLRTLETNIRGTYCLLDACRSNPNTVTGIIVASSDKAYGVSPHLPYEETLLLNPCYPYDVSKACADLLARSYAVTFELPVTVVRCGNIYGEGDRNWNRVIPGTIRSLYGGERPIVRSDGHLVRDYLYIDDAVTAFLSLAENLSEKHLEGEAFNFAMGDPISVLEVVGKITRLMKKENLKPVILNEARHEISKQYLSWKKAEKVLGWAPQFSLEEGLIRTIKGYHHFFESTCETMVRVTPAGLCRA